MTDPVEVQTNVVPLDRAMTPAQRLDLLLAKNGDPAIIQSMMDLQERYEDRQARQEFIAARAAAKAKIKPVVRKTEGHNNKKFADLASISEAVDEILSENGLSYYWSTAQDNGTIRVTCILEHVSGHSLQTELSGAPDQTGNKNAIQAVGSTVTYLERYTLMALLGIAQKHGDDDGDAAGKKTGKPTITEQQIIEIEALLKKWTTPDYDARQKFLAGWKIKEVSEISADDFERAVFQINENRKKRGLK